MLGFGLIIPALPLFAETFGVGPAGLGLLVTSFAAMRLMGNVVVGRFLVRYGERAVTVFGAAVVGLSSLAVAAATSYPMLLVLRAAGGVGSAFYFGGLLSFLLARVTPEQRGRATSLFHGSVAAGLLLGPVIGGILVATRGAEFPFVVYGIACLIGSAWSYRVMSAPISEHANAVGPPDLQVLRTLLKDRSYRLALLAAMIGFVVMMSPQVLLSSLFSELGIGDGKFGIPFAVVTAASLAVVVHAGNLVDRRGRRGALIVGSFGLAAGVAAISVAQNLAGIVAAMFVVGASSGYTRPAATSIMADVATVEQRNVAVGGFRVAQDIGALVGPLIAGLVSQSHGPRAGFVTVAALAGLAAVACMAVRETAPHLVGAGQAAVGTGEGVLEA